MFKEKEKDLLPSDSTFVLVEYECKNHDKTYVPLRCIEVVETNRQPKDIFDAIRKQHPLANMKDELKSDLMLNQDKKSNLYPFMMIAEMAYRTGEVYTLSDIYTALTSQPAVMKQIDLGLE